LNSRLLKYLDKVQPAKSIRLYPVFGCLLFCLLIIVCNYAGAKIEYTGTGYRTTTVYSEGNSNRWWMGESLTKARFTTENFGLKLGLSLTQSYPNGDLRWNYDDKTLSLSKVGDAENGILSGRIFFQEQYTQSQFSVAAFSDKLISSLGWRYISNQRQEYSAGINIKPLHTLSIGFKRSNLYPLSSFSELFYTYESDGKLEREGGQINWEAPAWMNRFSANLSLLECIDITSTISEYNFRPHLPLEGESSFGTYLGTIDGLWYDSRIKVEYKTNPDWSTDIAFRQLGIRNHLQMYDGGKKFANFGVIEADVDIWSVGFGYKNYRLSFQTGNGQGELSGQVKAWPFVDGLLQFLGERRHFVGVAEVDWRLTTINGDMLNKRHLFLNASLDYLYVRPIMSYATWKPQSLFGIGIEDLKSGKLDIIRADLLRLTVCPTIKFSRFKIEFYVSQWLPLYTKKHENNQKSSSSSQDNGEDDNSNSDKELTKWGGFDASINLKLEF